MSEQRKLSEMTLDEMLVETSMSTSVVAQISMARSLERIADHVDRLTGMPDCTQNESLSIDLPDEPIQVQEND